MELIDRIKKDIDDRLEELRPQIEEVPRLEAALAALDATGGDEAESSQRRVRARGQSSGAGRRGPRRRARRGQRREELLQIIRGNPEVTIAEAARQMGVSAPQVSTLVRRLREEGVLERADGRFVVVESTTFADGAGDAEAPGDEGPNAGSETPGAEAPTVEGPGVESLQPAEGGDEVADAPEAARDEAGRPQAT